MNAMKSGYIYVLVHPSDPDLYKIGITTRKPEQRLDQHNRDYAREAGRIVKETGERWKLKEYHAVLDPYWAEVVFWEATPITLRQGIEVQKMDREWVQAGLDAAKKAGMRPGPKPLPDYVYANNAWINKRLAGRGITLNGNVRSKHGKSNFQCSNGHEWRIVPNDVAEGKGCPHCGMGEKDAEEIRQAVETGYLWLLINPDKPGLIRIDLTYGTRKHCDEDNVWDNWQIHRYRYVEEPALAESLIWELLDHPRPDDSEPVNIDLSIPEQAFRNLMDAMQIEIALMEKRRRHEN